MTPDRTQPSPSRSIAIGIACGVGAAVFWAAGFVAARHGIDIGFTPADITFHRCFWAGVVLLPLALRDGISDLNGIGWTRGIVLTFFGGLGIAFVSYSGFLLVPLGHGGIIQPSTAALLGLVLSTVVLHERLPAKRVTGALVIVAGLIVIGGEAITNIGVHGVAGDLLFVLAGAFFATFGMFLRKWRVAPTRAMIVTSVLSLAILPIYGVLVGFPRRSRWGFGRTCCRRFYKVCWPGPARSTCSPVPSCCSRRAGSSVSDPGAAWRAADRLDRARLGADCPAIYRACDRADWDSG